MTTARTRLAIRLLLFAFALLTAYWVFGGFIEALNGSKDNEWGPARALLRGMDPYRLYLDCLPCANPPYMPSVAPSYPVSGLLMLWPLAILPWPVAKVVWAGLNLCFGLGLSLALWRRFAPEIGWGGFALATLVLFSGTPFLNNLGNGQHAVFTLVFFAGALWAEHKGKTTLASVLLAVSWFKYTISLPLSLFFLVRGRWRPVLAAAAIHVVLTIFSAAWTGANPLDLLLGPLRVAHVATTAGDLNLLAIARQLGIESKLVPLIAAGALTIAVAIAALRSRRDSDLPLLSLLALFDYAVVYHLGYDLVVLAIPLFYVLKRSRSWDESDGLERIWTIMLASLLAWAWFIDHPIQMMKIQHVGWVVNNFAAYHLALAVWFYLALGAGIVLVARRRSDPSPTQPMTSAHRNRRRAGA